MRRLLLFCGCLVYGFLLVAQNCSSFSFTVSPPDTLICPGQSVTLNANATYYNPWYPINMQSYYNINWAGSTNSNPMIIPTGDTVLGGVPFTLAPCSNCNNSWNAAYQPGNNPIILSIPLNRKIDSLFSLINTFWGTIGGPYASVELMTNGQIVYQQALYADTNIRDYNPDGWTNFINGTSTFNVYLQPGTGRRLDMVTMGLPINLVNTVIDSILYVDNGGNQFQRMVVTGITVKTDTSTNNGISYLWSTGDTTSAISVSPLQSTVYSVSAMSGDGACSASASINVNIDSIGPVVVQANPTTICSNDSIAVCAPPGYSSYQWNVYGASNSNCTEATVAGNYYVTVTDASGCTAQSNQLAISVYPVPSVSIVIQGDTLSSYGAASYQWYLNNNPIPNATGLVYIAREQGYYSIEITDTNGCTAISSPVEIEVAGVNDLTKEGNILLYPNPCSVASVQLSVGSELIGSELEIYNDEGRIIFHSELRTQNSKLTLDIPSGIYYLRISSANVSVIRKLVKL